MSEHWYTRGGQSAYTVNGRDTTLRDARKLALVPSVTTVWSCVAKPALVTWQIEQAIMASLTLPRVDGETNEAWLARIREDSKQTALKAANEGTRIHNAIEASFVNTWFNDYINHVNATRAELARLFPDVTDWVSEQSFAHPLGYGGKVDLHSPSTGIVVDFKTKDGDFSDGKRLAYDQNVQLAAYQVGLGIHGGAEDSVLMFRTCANIFVSRTHPGKVASHLWSADEIAQGWRQFECALSLWKCLKNFDPSF